MPVAAIEEQKLRRRIRELAQRHVRWGRRLVYRRLRLEGWSVNHKRVQRIWREEGIQRPLPRRRKRCRPADGSRELLRANYPHHVWAIDFQFDQTMDGRALKFLNVLDEYSRVCLAIRVGRRCKAVDVIEMGFPRFGGRRSGIRGSECTGSDELLLVVDRAQVAQC